MCIKCNKDRQETIDAAAYAKITTIINTTIIH